MTEIDQARLEALKGEATKKMVDFIDADPDRAKRNRERLSALTLTDGKVQLKSKTITVEDIRETIGELQQVCVDAELPLDAGGIRRWEGIVEIFQRAETEVANRKVEPDIVVVAPETDKRGVWYEGIVDDLRMATKYSPDKYGDKPRPVDEVRRERAQRSAARKKLEENNLSLDVMLGVSADPRYKRNEVRAADAIAIVFGGRRIKGSTMTEEEAKALLSEIGVDWEFRGGERGTSAEVKGRNDEAPASTEKATKRETWNEVLEDEVVARDLVKLFGAWDGKSDFQEVVGGLSRERAEELLLRIMRLDGNDALGGLLGLADAASVAEAVEKGRRSGIDLSLLLGITRENYFIHLIGGEESKAVQLRSKLEMGGSDLSDKARINLVGKSTDGILGELIQAKKVGKINGSPEGKALIEKLKHWALCKDYDKEEQAEDSVVVENGVNRERYSEEDWKLLKQVHTMLEAKYAQPGNMQSAFAYAAQPGAERFNAAAILIGKVSSPELKKQLTSELTAVSWLHDEMQRFNTLQKFEGWATSEFSPLESYLETLLHMENEHGFMTAKSMVEYDNLSSEAWLQNQRTPVSADDMTDRVRALSGNTTNSLYQMVALDLYRITGGEARYAYSAKPNRRAADSRGTFTDGSEIDSAMGWGDGYKKHDNVGGGSAIVSELIHTRRIFMGKNHPVSYWHVDSGMTSFWEEIANPGELVVIDPERAYSYKDTDETLNRNLATAKKAKIADPVRRDYFTPTSKKYARLSEDMLLGVRFVGSSRSVGRENIGTASHPRFVESRSPLKKGKFKDWLTDLGYMQETKLQETIMLGNMAKSAGVADFLVSKWGAQFYVNRGAARNRMAEARVLDLLEWHAGGSQPSYTKIREAVVKFQTSALISPEAAKRLLAMYPITLSNTTEKIEFVGSAMKTVGEIIRELTSQG